MRVKFVNRVKELDFLSHQRATLGKSNNVVLLCGESGVGKSELTQKFLEENSSVVTIKVAIRKNETERYEAGYYLTKLAQELNRASQLNSNIKSLSVFLREITSSAYGRGKIWKSFKGDLKKFPGAETVETLFDITFADGEFDLRNFFRSTDSEILFALNDYVKEVLNNTSAIINFENFQGIDARSLDLLTPIIKYGHNSLYILEFTEKDDNGYSFFELTSLLERNDITFSSYPVKPLTLLEVKKIIEDQPAISWDLFQRSYVNWDGNIRSLMDLLARLKHGLLTIPEPSIDLSTATKEHLLTLSRSELFVIMTIYFHGEGVQRSLLAKLITFKDAFAYVIDLNGVLSSLERRSLIKQLGDEIILSHDSIGINLGQLKEASLFSLLAYRFWFDIYNELLSQDDLYAAKGWKLMKVLNFASLLHYDAKIYALLDEIGKEALKSRDPEKMILYVRNVEQNLANVGEDRYKERLLQIRYWLIELFYKIGNCLSAWNVLEQIHEDNTRKYKIVKAILLEQVGKHNEALAFCNKMLAISDGPHSFELALRLVRLVTNFDIGNTEETKKEFHAAYSEPGYRNTFEYGFLLRNAELVFPIKESLPYYKQSIEHFEKFGAVRQAAFSRITYGVHLGLIGELQGAKVEFEKAKADLENVITERHTILNNLATLLLFEQNISDDTEILLRQAMLTATGDFERITLNIGYLVLMDWRGSREEAERAIVAILEILRSPSFAGKEIIRYAYFDIYKYYERIGKQTLASEYRKKLKDLALPETPIWKFWLYQTPISENDEEFFLSTVNRAFSFLCNWNMEYDSSLMRFE